MRRPDILVLNVSEYWDGHLCFLSFPFELGTQYVNSKGPSQIKVGPSDALLNSPISDKFLLSIINVSTIPSKSAVVLKQSWSSHTDTLISSQLEKVEVDIERKVAKLCLFRHEHQACRVHPGDREGVGKSGQQQGGLDDFETCFADRGGQAAVRKEVVRQEAEEELRE